MLLLFTAVAVAGAIAAALWLQHRQRNRVYISAKFTQKTAQSAYPSGIKATPPTAARKPPHSSLSSTTRFSPTPAPKAAAPSTPTPALTSIDRRARTRAQAKRLGRRVPAGSPAPSAVPAPARVEIPDYFTPPAKPRIKPRQPSRDYPKLIRLLHGDRAAATRLIQGLLDSYPDCSESWCYEKALFDLERDRR